MSLLTDEWSAPTFGMSNPTNYVETSSANFAGTGITSTPASAGMGAYAGPAMGIMGAISSGLGAFFSSQSAANNLRFQKDMATINARMAEQTAQSIMLAGEKAQGQVGMRAGKVKSAQKASLAARGITAGEGSAAEEIATTDLVKEIDMLTINANTTRQAWAARTQGVNMSNEALMKGTTADSISPFSAMGTSMLNSATSVASTWYRNNRLDRLASALGVE